MALNKVIELHTNLNLDKLAQDYIENVIGNFSAEKVAEHLEDITGEIYTNPTLRKEIYKRFLVGVAQSNINKRKAGNYIKNGQMDWLAYRTAVISLGDKMYIKVEHASASALRLRQNEQRENIGNAQRRYEIEKAATDNLIEFMELNAIQTAGEAMEKMGLI